MSDQVPASEALLTPAEVAGLFRVDPKTVTRWAKAGKLTSIRTLGGHRRYREVEVRAVLACTTVPQAAAGGQGPEPTAAEGQSPEPTAAAIPTPRKPPRSRAPVADKH